MAVAPEEALSHNPPNNPTEPLKNLCLFERNDPTVGWKEEEIEKLLLSQTLKR